MKQKFLYILRNKFFLIGTALLLLYSLSGFFLLPYLIEKLVPRYAQDPLQRQASIGDVQFNPFLLTFEARDFQFQEADGRPIVRFRRLFFDFETASLLQWTWIVDDIQLDGLQIALDQQSNGRLNFATLADRFANKETAVAAKKEAVIPTKEKGDAVRFWLPHIGIKDGAFTYTDHTAPKTAKPASFGLTAINIDFQNLSTLPEHQGTFSAQAKIPSEGNLLWKGDFSLPTLTSKGELKIQKFQLASIWSLLQAQLQLEAPKGRVDLNTAYQFMVQPKQSQYKLSNLQLLITDLALQQPNAKNALLQLAAIEVKDGRFDLAAHQLTLPKLTIRDGQVRATQDKAGKSDWQSLMKPSKPLSTTPTKAADTKTVKAPSVIAKPVQQTPPNTKPSAKPKPKIVTTPWKIHVDALQLEKIAVQLTDEQRVTPLAISLGQVGVAVKLSATLGESEPQLLAENIAVNLANIALTQAGQKEPLASLKGLALKAGTLDSLKRQVNIQHVILREGSTRIIRADDRSISLITALKTAASASEKSASKPKAEIVDKRPAWAMQMDTLTLENFHTTITDQKYEPALELSMQEIKATITNLTNDPQKPISFDAALKVAQGGDLHAKGNFLPDLASADAELTINQLNCMPLQTVFARYTTLELKSGTASMTSILQYRTKDATSNFQGKGQFNLSDLLVKEAASGDRFLAWKTFDANEMAFSLSPDTLSIKEIKLVEPGAKIMIFEDSSFNFAKAFKKQETEPKAKGSDANPAEKQTTAATQTKNKFEVSVEKVRVTKANVDFSDRSLLLPFAAKIHDLGGTLIGVSSDPNRRAKLQFQGRVDEYGSAKISGDLRPFAPKQYTNIRTEFQHVAMSPLSPYSATFAGRKIASGTLSLDLQYKVIDNQMKGQNSVLLDQFTLGEKVNSAKALDLPLDLAIALLTDSKGKINIAVPVAGNVDSPTFNVGKVIGKAFVGALTNIVTAPFRALGGLFGGNGKEPALDAVYFSAGSDQLQPSQLEILRTLAQALQKRPQLNLIIGGRYHAKKDGAALRSDRVRRELATMMDEKLDADEDPEPIVFDDAKTQRALEAQLQLASGEEGLTKFKANFEKAKGRKATQVNFALALIGTASDDLEFYEAIFKQLVAVHSLADADLPALAQGRANAVMQALIKDAGLTPERVSIGKIEPVKESKNEKVETRLMLDAGVTKNVVPSS